MATTKKALSKAEVEEKAIGTEINRLFAARTKIKKAEDKISEMKAAFKEQEEALRKRLVKSKMDSARGAKATVTVGTRKVCKIGDYNKFATYILKNKALDCFQNRPSITAINARIENGEKVPGIEFDEIPILSMRARK